MSYEEARKIVKENKINSESALEKFVTSKVKPDKFPDHPQMAYQRKGWLSFDEFVK